MIRETPDENGSLVAETIAVLPFLKAGKLPIRRGAIYHLIVLSLLSHNVHVYTNQPSGCSVADRDVLVAFQPRRSRYSLSIASIKLH